MTRRPFLGASTVAGGALAIGRIRPATTALPATVDLGGVAVVPRSAWGGDLPPTQPLPKEPRVRFWLVHHSVDPGNEYLEAGVPGNLRRSPTASTSIASAGCGRAAWGAWAGPVTGAATGGNQGFDQLRCFLGNHQTSGPPTDAFAATGRLLGALARRCGVDSAPGATTTFTLRGSNRHPAGAVVATDTVAGHRDMSRTQSPGEIVFYARLAAIRSAAADDRLAVHDICDRVRAGDRHESVGHAVLGRRRPTGPGPTAAVAAAATAGAWARRRDRRAPDGVTTGPTSDAPRYESRASGSTLRVDANLADPLCFERIGGSRHTRPRDRLAATLPVAARSRRLG